MTVEYKVWVHIEKGSGGITRDEGPEYEDVGEPVELGCFDTEGEARNFVDILELTEEVKP